MKTSSNKVTIFNNFQFYQHSFELNFETIIFDIRKPDKYLSINTLDGQITTFLQQQAA